MQTRAHPVAPAYPLSSYPPEHQLALFAWLPDELFARLLALPPAASPRPTRQVRP